LILIPALPDSDLVRAIERVKRKTGERWSADFVIRKIRNGEAQAFRFDDGTEHLAWMVVEAYGDPRIMNVWILEGWPGIENRDRMVRLIDELATSIGAKKWKMESPRKGWARMLRGYITRTRTVYERDLP
jgi:hypothetical protein